MTELRACDQRRARVRRDGRRVTDCAWWSATLPAPRRGADGAPAPTRRPTGPPRLAPGAAAVDAAFDGELAALLAVAGATGRADEVVKIPTRGTITAPLLVAVGLGPAGDDGPSAEQLRRASGAAARALAGTDHAVTTLSWSATDARLPTPWPPPPRAPCSGPTRSPTTRRPTAAGRCAGSTSRPTPPRPPTRRPCCTGRRRSPRPSPPPATWSTPRRTTSTRRASPRGPPRWARPPGSRSRCSTTRRSPPAATAACSGSAAGSSRKPRLVRLRWSGGPAPRATVALVGKGITFDTGGISIKPAAHMDHMTSDMAGAAAVVATAVLAARLELPVAVTATGADGREHAVGDRVPARRRAADVRRPDRRGAQHRRRGPADPGRRDRPRPGGRARLPDRDLDAHRRPARRARPAHRRR